MCGIAGFLGLGDLTDAQNMCAALARRGPDGAGVFKCKESPVFLTHRRLAVIDLDGGDQPMRTADGTLTLVYNGEVYNHQELRKELEAKGHVFVSNHSDTEVLLHGWREWREDLPGKLNGMFAFAIWDKNEKRLFLARDRFGEKPLFWAKQKDTLFFASELTALRGHRHFDASPSIRSLQKYFAHGYIPAPNSIYENCWKLGPGEFLSHSFATGQTDVRTYWKFRIQYDDNPPNFNQATEELRDLLQQSVRRRMMSDVPLGVFLSGGVDSSLVASMASKETSSELMSFCIGFKETSFDESSFARHVAAAVGTTHHERFLDFDNANALIDEVLPKLDEPMCDGSILPTYMLCKFAREHVTVSLSGDGGDELFAGYDPFSALLPAQIYSKLVPRSVHKGVQKLAQLLPMSDKNMSLDFKIRRTLQGLNQGPELWLPAWMAPATLNDVRELFEMPADPEDVYSEVLSLWREDDSKNLVDKSLEYYTSFYLPDDILTKVDRASMMNSLETRSIFLDNDLVDYVRKLPAAYKFDGRKRKKILKAAARGLVPDEILDRPKKGFGIPLNQWLRQIRFQDETATTLPISKDKMARFIQSHQNKDADHRLLLWAWLTLKKVVV